MNDVSSLGARGTTDQRYQDATRALILKYRLIGIIPAVILGLVLGFVHPGVGIVAALVVAAGWYWYTVQRLRGAATEFAAGLSTTEVQRADQPRLWNLIDGLCITSGVQHPKVHLLASAQLNALVVVDEDDIVVVITQGIVDQLDRIELEAVLAHLLMRVKDGSAQFYTTAFRLLGDGPRGERVVEQTLGSQWSVKQDLAAVSMTKYPPGMISALSKIHEVGSQIDSPVQDMNAMWFADPSRTDSRTSDTALQSVSYRQAVLEEL